MAAVIMPASPRTPSKLPRRVPLGENHNATNRDSSRLLNAATSSKRPRSRTFDQRESTCIGQPPPKRLQLATNAVDTRSKTTIQNTRGDELNVADSIKTLQKQEAGKPQYASQREIDERWREHHMKEFPQRVFFFESLPPNDCLDYKQLVRKLGARVDTFFSKEVTHVVTARRDPKDEPTASSSQRRAILCDVVPLQGGAGQQRGVRSSHPTRSAELSRGHNALAHGLAAARKPGISKVPSLPHAVNPRVGGGNSNNSNNDDVLSKAEKAGMHIWSSAKLFRILKALRQLETTKQDLAGLLKNEKVNGPADRDPTVVDKDVRHLRDYYIYVHDMNEEFRCYVKEYPKPPSKQESKYDAKAKKDAKDENDGNEQKTVQGLWPELRYGPPGRCPFAPGPAYPQKTRPVIAWQVPGESARASRTRSVSAAPGLVEPSLPKAGPRRSLTENNIATRASLAIAPQPRDPLKITSANRNTSHANAPFNPTEVYSGRMPRYTCGEPIASGIQPSNITSAIKSQAVSSAAGVPGTRLGTSKLLTQMDRKVIKTYTTSKKMAPFVAGCKTAIGGDFVAPARDSKRVDEADDACDSYSVHGAGKQNRRRVIIPHKKTARGERAPRPGYCENCRETYKDFDIHIASRKHRKFATTESNWEELDALLAKVNRPLL